MEKITEKVTTKYIVIAAAIILVLVVAVVVYQKQSEKPCGDGTLYNDPELGEICLGVDPQYYMTKLAINHERAR